MAEKKKVTPKEPAGKGTGSRTKTAATRVTKRQAKRMTARQLRKA